jgi:hypothetical protein
MSSPAKPWRSTAFRSCTADQLIGVLDETMAATGHKPEHIRMDNGTEMTAHAMRDWCRFTGVDPAFIDPASPWQNWICESFNGRFRDEFLACEQFCSLTEAQVLAEDWRIESAARIAELPYPGKSALPRISLCQRVSVWASAAIYVIAGAAESAGDGGERAGGHAAPCESDLMRGPAPGQVPGTQAPTALQIRCGALHSGAGRRARVLGETVKCRRRVTLGNTGCEQQLQCSKQSRAVLYAVVHQVQQGVSIRRATAQQPHPPVRSALRQRSFRQLDNDLLQIFLGGHNVLGNMTDQVHLVDCRPMPGSPGHPNQPTPAEQPAG